MQPETWNPKSKRIAKDDELKTNAKYNLRPGA
jgi:hypothetical protein